MGGYIHVKEVECHSFKFYDEREFYVFDFFSATQIINSPFTISTINCITALCTQCIKVMRLKANIIHSKLISSLLSIIQANINTQNSKIIIGIHLLSVILYLYSRHKYDVFLSWLNDFLSF